MNVHASAATVAPPAAQARAGEVRRFGPADLLAVATLFQRIFLRRGGPVSAELVPCLAEIFLEHPWSDPELPSRVYVTADGVIRGFLGVIPVRMLHHGRPVRMAVASSIMVDKPEDNPLAGARLLRTFFQGPQDLSLTETASPVSRQMWLRLGAKVLPMQSLQWMRILRPAGLGAYLAARHVLPQLKVLRLPAAMLDALLARRSRMSPVPISGLEARGSDVAPEELAQVIPDMISEFSLHPNFDLPTLRWLLIHAARKECYGTPVARIVFGRRGTPVGCYLGHVCPLGVFRVLQIIAVPSGAEIVTDDVLAHACRLGAVVVTGKGQPELQETLQLRRCYFRGGGFTLVHSHSPELIGALCGADAFANGLAGETWIRLIGGEFGRATVPAPAHLDA